MTQKLNHENLFMSEVSSSLKRIRFVLIGKKKFDFDLSKCQICFMVCEEKWFLEIKNPNLCCDDKKMVFNDNRKIRYVFYMF